jgi:hypothetical protein
MYKPITIEGHWKGYYEYGEDYEELEGEKGYFIAEIKELGEGFVGKVNDIDGTSIIEEEGELKGFFDGSFISFTKTYPDRHDVDGNIEYSVPHIITYEGKFLYEEGSFKGTWEIIDEEIKLSPKNLDESIYNVESKEILGKEPYMETLSKGTWEMWKVK